MVETKFQSPTQRGVALRRFSPRKDDSPSRQLGFELEKALEQLQIHDFERRKVHAYNRRSYHEELDAKDLALAKSHMEALDAASAKHEAVRQEAEAVLQRHLKDQEEKRRREEEEERRRQEREAREKAERERKAKEEAERKVKLERERQEAEAKKAAEEKARAEAAEEERKQREIATQKRREEQQRAEKEKADKDATAKAEAEKQAAENAKAQQAKAQAQKETAAAKASPSQPGFYAASPEAELHHREFLVLHRKLKQFRKDFWEQAKQNKPVKAEIGEMRRAMRTSVGQLTDDKVGNKKATERVKSAIIRAFKEVPSPEVAVSDFLPTHLSLNDQGSTKIPSLIIYLISILSKAIINAFTGECAVNTRAAEPIGTLTAQVFSLAELQFTRQGTSNNSNPYASLIPILLAKFHKVAPVLFGISGPETTQAGRIRIGWRTEAQDNSDTRVFVLEQRQHERMTGLGAGFSSIALRNFSKTKLRNPFPPTNFWFAIASIINTPPADVQTSHLLLLKSMLENNAADRFILFYGNVAIAVLREALVNFPAKLPEKMRNGAACRNLGLMVDSFEKEKHLRLK